MDVVCFDSLPYMLEQVIEAENDFAEGDEVAFDCTPADLVAWFKVERPDRHDRIVVRFDSQPKGKFTRKHFSARVAK